MPRNRIISQSEALFVTSGASDATGYMLSIAGTGGLNLLGQLQRVQSANYSTNIAHTPVNQYGQLAAIDRLIIQAPTASLTFDYLVANTFNANLLGFATNGVAGALSGILTKEQDEKNYFILTTREGTDVFGNTDAASTKYTIGFGNGVISNFSAAGSVGNFPTESVSVEALNYVTYAGATGLASPAIIPSGGQRISTLGPNNFSIPAGTSGQANAVSAIRPGDITITLSDPVFGPSVADMKIQSYNISVPISLQPISKLGSPFPFSKEIQFPVDVTLQIEAQLGDLVTGDLSALYCNEAAQTIIVNLAKPQCGGGGPTAVRYTLAGAKLEGQNVSSSIGANKTVSLTYVSSIGSAVDLVNNLFISGSLF